MKHEYTASMTYNQILRGAGIKMVFIALCLLLALTLCYSPVYASESAEAEQQTTGTCVWNGRTYTAGSYFYNSAGQQYVCNSDGSITYIGVTLGSPPVYPYPYTDPVPNAAISEVTCSYNGNEYYVGQYFWNQVGQQFVCNSDGTMSYLGVVGGTGVYSTGSQNLLLNYSYTYPNANTQAYTYSYMPAGSTVAYPSTSYTYTYPYTYNYSYPYYYGYYYTTP